MKKKKGTRLLAVLLAALIVSSTSALVYAADTDTNTTDTTVSSSEENIYAFPDEMPTASIPDNLLDGTYTVPVYMYVSNQDEASMGNGALSHTATITINNGIATAHLTFHEMPFLDAYGHLEKLWIYNSPNADGEGERIEVNADKTEWIVFEKTRVKTLVDCSFTMPSVNNIVRCRVQVDAMGDSLQDARLVFDFSSLADYVSNIDFSVLKAKITEAEAIDNSDGKYTSNSYSEMQDSLDYGKSVVTNANATQENVDMAVEVVQNGIDNLIPCVQDKSALQALVDEANQYNNDDGKYTEDSYSAVQQMLQFANYVLDNDDISLEVYDNVVNALRNAIDGLVETGLTPVEVDTSVLEQKISECVTIVNTDGMYTEESYSEFTAALENAKAVLADDKKHKIV